jgi:D-glycero-D-manno-heptose 1,7-bisphosphate phosphatase
MIKAAFIDRDGTINKNRKGYTSKIEEFFFIEGTFEAMKNLQKEYELFIITNQSGIGRGYYTEEDYNLLTRYMINHLQFNGVGIDISKVHHCPHKPEDDCNCRKPRTGMLEKISSLYRIDFPNSWVIGDANSDIELGKNMGCKTVQIGNQVKDLLEASNYILNQELDTGILLK